MLSYLLPIVLKIGTPSFRRWVLDVVPLKNAHILRDMSDYMWALSKEIYEGKKKALEQGDEAVERQIGRGKDIMSILSKLCLYICMLRLLNSFSVVKLNMAEDTEVKLDEEEVLGQMSLVVLFVNCVPLYISHHTLDVCRILIFAAMDTTSVSTYSTFLNCTILFMTRWLSIRALWLAFWICSRIDLRCKTNYDKKFTKLYACMRIFRMINWFLYPTWMRSAERPLGCESDRTKDIPSLITYTILASLQSRKHSDSTYLPVNFSSFHEHYLSANQDTILPLSNPVTGVDGTLISELHIPKNTSIIISALNSNRNPAIWGPDALEWKPERWLSSLPDELVDAKIPGVYSHL